MKIGIGYIAIMLAAFGIAEASLAAENNTIHSNHEVISTKGTPSYPLPDGCQNASGGTYGQTPIKNLEFPQLNGTELLACVDQKTGKRYFRLRLNILVKKADGKYETQVADEALLPWKKGVNPSILSVAMNLTEDIEDKKCVMTDDSITQTGLGPYAIGLWGQQADDSLLLENILVAWIIDESTRTIKIIDSKKLRCTSPMGC